MGEILLGFFDMFRLLADWLKAMMILAPPLFILALAAILLHHRRVQTLRKERLQAELQPGLRGKLVHAVSRLDNGELQIFRCEEEIVIPPRHLPPLAPMPGQEPDPVQETDESAQP